MKKILGILVLTFGASVAMANPAGLVGKWASPCNQGNFEATEFFTTVTEFLADGTANSRNYIYESKACLAPEVRQDGRLDATYTATDTDLVVVFTIDSKSAELRGSYQVTEDTLNFTPTSWIVDGQVQDIPDPVTLKRIQ